MSRAGAAVALGTAVWAGLCLGGALAHGQALTEATPHTHGDAALDAWFSALRQPDHPNTACCGPDDQFYASSYEPDPAVPGGFVVQVEPAHGRPAATVRVPPEKVNWADVHANGTGRGVIFLSVGDWTTGISVYCFVPGMGA